MLNLIHLSYNFYYLDSRIQSAYEIVMALDTFSLHHILQWRHRGFIRVFKGRLWNVIGISVISLNSGPLTADRKQKTALVESIKIRFFKQSKNIPVHAAEFLNFFLDKIDTLKEDYVHYKPYILGKMVCAFNKCSIWCNNSINLSAFSLLLIFSSNFLKFLEWTLTRLIIL